MATPVTVPRLGWNMEEGTFVEWLKATEKEQNRTQPEIITTTASR